MTNWERIKQFVSVDRFYLIKHCGLVKDKKGNYFVTHCDCISCEDCKFNKTDCVTAMEEYLEKEVTTND